MNIDIRTIAIVLSLSNLLQVIALVAQFRVNRSRRGLGYWTLGSTAVALGFAFTSLRDSSALGDVAIVANDVFFIAGLSLMYVGLLRFLGQVERRGWLLGFGAAAAVVFTYFTYLHYDLLVRHVAISLSLAALAFLIARALIVHRVSSVAGSASFLAAVFLGDAGFFALRALSPIVSAPAVDLFSNSLTQTATYLVALVTTTLWTFGFIILLNQRLNEESREAKDNLELIFNTSPDSVLITRLDDSRFVLVNDGFSSITGYTRAEVIGKSVLEIQLWKNPADREKLVAMLNEKGSCENLEAVFQRKDGSQFVGLLSAKLTTLQGVRHIVSVTRDISERQRVEAALRESEERYRELVENASDIVYTLDLAGRFTSANRAAERITGYAREEILGLNLSQVTSPEDYARARQMLEEKVRTERPTTYSLDVYAKDGHRVSLELSTRLIYQDGRVVGSQGIARDVTERKRLLEELEQQATTDELTGISNRRQFVKLAEEEVKRARRLKHPLTIVILDLDRLKEINDTYGHAAGDQMLQSFARNCKAHIREIDRLARLGGDEFGLLLPEANRQQAFQALARVRASLAAAPIPLDSQSIPVTFSAGICSLASGEESLDELLRRADQLMYQAKQAGRDQVEVERG